jgi:hypothetical protein
MDFLRVRLLAPLDGFERLVDFYAGLGIDQAGKSAFAVGTTGLEFASSQGEPFYHFALLVPGDRFGAALDWARERVELLPDPETGDVVFDFPAWEAKALYFHDPAGTIVELIAHGGIGEAGAEGPFSSSELLGFSELGLVGPDTRAMAGELGRLGLELWDGTLDEPGRLAFVGERGRTLILTPEGRGWLPTGRPAEPHAAEAVLSGPPEGELRLAGAGHRIVRSRS